MREYTKYKYKKSWENIIRPEEVSKNEDVPKHEEVQKIYERRTKKSD